MKKQVKLTVKETAATNKDFYNLFRPIAPSIDIIGKVAQVVSGLTEAITIWHITQSELSGMSKAISIGVSILATLLVVALLELGGRKFLQVATRALVWKRLKNAWYTALFVIVALITVGMGVISFRLSTNGIHHAFVSNVPILSTFDDSALKQEYHTNVQLINDRMDKELELLQTTHRESVLRLTQKYDAQVAATQLKVDDYTYRANKGMAWATSHVEKYRNQIGSLQTEKAAALAALNEAHTAKVAQWQGRKNEALATEKTALTQARADAERKVGKIHRAQSENASFWGMLFSYLVGFSVVLAFVCIVTVEVYRRGAGIQVEYAEEDKKDAILWLYWYGLTHRIDRFFRVRAERFAQVSHTTSGSRTIGFNHSGSYASAKNTPTMPTAEYED